MRRLGVSVLVVVAGVLASCKGDATTATGSARPHMTVCDFPEPPPRVTPGPAPTTESEAMRERVVLGLLEGSGPIDDIPVEATDDGAPLDPTLRSRLSTTSAQRAPVRMGPVTTTEGLPKEVVQRILRQHLGRVRACFEKGLTTNPNLMGTLELRFTIGKTGSVYEPTATGDLPSPPMRTCVTTVLTASTFPQPEGGRQVTVTTSYTFTPF